MKAELLSWIYKRKRGQVIREIFAKQDREGRARNFEEVFKEGDNRLRKLSRWMYIFPIPKGIGAHLYDLYFPSMLTLASFKNELDIVHIWSCMGLGGVILKTAFKDDRKGNCEPRLQQVFVDGIESLINAMGFPGKSADGRIAEFEDSPLLFTGKPIGLGIGGNPLDEYKLVFDKYHAFASSKTNLAYFFEVDISCPNTPEGQKLSQHPEQLEDLLTHMRSKTNAVIGVKFSPDMPDRELLKFAELLLRYPRMYANLGNTTRRKCADLGLPETAISIGGGGLSGPSLYSRTLAMTKLVAPTGIPIIATGGIGTAEQVMELRNNGATLIGMATSVGHDPYRIPLINKELVKYRI